MGAAVTIVAILGSLPYIALQLKSLSMAGALLTAGTPVAGGERLTVLALAGVLAGFAIDGQQERVGESIFLFAPSCVTVTTASSEEASSPTTLSRGVDSPEPVAAPSPAWGRQASAF